MDIYTILGYCGGIIILLHLCYHLIQTTVLKLKVRGGIVDMIAYDIGTVFILIYAISRKDLPVILFAGALAVFSLLGHIDLWKRIKKSK